MRLFYFLKRCFLVIVFLGFVLASFPGFAKVTHSQSFGPFPSRTQNPLYLQFLALPFDDATTLEKKQLEAGLQIAFSNIYELSLGSTLLTIDTELWRTALQARYGINDRMDIKIELPVVSQLGGFMDGFISGYHNLFGFPNGGRELRDQNSFAFDLIQNQNTLFSYKQNHFGFADPSLSFKYDLAKAFSFKKFHLALATAIKFPFGEASNGLSSGHFDFGFSLFFEKNLRRFHLHSQFGVVFLGGHNELDDFLRFGFFQFGQSLEFQLTNHLSLIGQLTGNTSAFSGFDVDVLSGTVVDLSLGVAGEVPITHPLAETFFYKVAFSEDILSRGPSIDFTLLFTTGFRY